MDLEIRISLHKTSFYMHKKNKIFYAYRCTKQIPDPKICRNGEILRINDFRFKLVLLVLHENKISKPKRRGRAFETRGRVSWFDLLEFLFAFKNKTECTNLPRYSHGKLEKQFLNFINATNKIKHDNYKLDEIVKNFFNKQLTI